MTMTREKAIETLENHTQYYVPIQDLNALKFALTALRGPTREMVKRMFPGCEVCKGAKYVTGSVSAVAPYDDQHETETYAEGDFDFCPNCGRPLTDEAVEMVMERMEEMKNG